MKPLILPALLASVLTASPAFAQMLLPGALQTGPDSAGKPLNSSGADSGGGPAKLRPITQRPPGEETVIGRDLSRNGSEGLITFQRAPEKTLEVTGLSMSGEEIAHPGEPCRIDVVAGAPIDAKPMGRPRGLLRYDVEIEACRFSLEVLDGAVLVAREPRTCDFVAADCRVDPTGLWGPSGKSIDAAQIKQMERARGFAETTMRSNFRALLSSAGKDKVAIKRIAGEQAGFSSEREVTCRNYSGEDVHGFCALHLTQGRALNLQAEFEANAKDRGDAKPTKAALKKKQQP
ncbi:MAG: hypothetical protein WDN46_05900 [Methylocella sp.]